jgi:phosphinothricin acetyltransferase
MAEIRAMTTEDWPEVARIYQAGIDTNLATFQPVCPSFEQFDAGHLSHCRLIICRDGGLAGWAALSATSRHHYYRGVCEASLYIAPDCRRQGIGKTLMEALIGCSIEHGVWTLQSVIMSDNASSLALHEKCGFRKVGYREKIGCDRRGVWRDTILMERREPSIQ